MERPLYSLPERVFSKLADNAVIATDNMLQPANWRADVKAYRDAVRAKPGIQSVLLPSGQGVGLSYLWGDAPASHL